MKRISKVWCLVISVCLLLVITVPVIAANEENAAKIENKEEKKEFSNKEGKLRLILTYQYPELTGNLPGIRKINETILKQKEDWFLSHKDLVESIQDEPDYGFKNTDEVSFLVTFNEKGLLSILEEGYLFTGGAHGMPYRMPGIFSLETGEKVPLSALFKTSDEQIKEKIVTAFDNLMKAHKDWYWPEALQIVKETELQKIGYYLTNEGVVFYFDPYLLAPYAAGFVEVVLPLPK